MSREDFFRENKIKVEYDWYRPIIICTECGHRMPWPGPVLFDLTIVDLNRSPFNVWSPHPPRKPLA